MNSPTELLTLNQWEAFDEFVNLIGAEDRWSIPASDRHVSTYSDLCAAGLLLRNPQLAARPEYCLTADGRREACARDGHEFNPNRPAADGCAMCDAVVCSSCEGFGEMKIDATDCENCNGTGVVERLTA